jgi:hypothetical protein
MIQKNERQDVMGSNDKPFPTERNFTMGANPEDCSTGYPVEPIPTKKNVSIGQAKYAKRNYGDSIYEDTTKMTEDDYEADERADMGCEELDVVDSEETQDGAY